MHISHFTSDTHYGHANIIGFCNRPFADVETMKAVLIAEYNRHVGKDDTVLWVGDCFLCGRKEAAEILAQLHGHKVLVRGNHDASAAAMARIGFDLVVDSLTMHIAGQTVRVHHYPYKSKAQISDIGKIEPAGLKWPDRRKDEFLIHGHVHSPTRREGRAIHVGVDAWDFRPASLAEVTQLVAEATSMNAARGVAVRGSSGGVGSDDPLPHALAEDERDAREALKALPGTMNVAEVPRRRPDDLQGVHEQVAAPTGTIGEVKRCAASLVEHPKTAPRGVALDTERKRKLARDYIGGRADARALLNGKPEDTDE